MGAQTPWLSLIGPRRAGKSTLARRLAEHWKRPAFDLDLEIARRQLRTPAEILREEGEPAFRAIELRVLREVLAEGGAILATGGGTIVQEAARALLLAAGPIVYLHLEPEAEIARYGSDRARESRPALLALGPEAEIRALAAVRTPIYRGLADCELDAELSTEALVMALSARFGSFADGGLPPSP